MAPQPRKSRGFDEFLQPSGAAQRRDPGVQRRLRIREVARGQHDADSALDSGERALEFADNVGPMLARVPSRRMSTPEEVAAAVVFLSGDDSANIHGSILSVDGGWAAV